MDLQLLGLVITMTVFFALQSPNLDLGLAANLVEGLKQTLKDSRTETHTEELWKEVIHTAKQCNSETDAATKGQNIQ